MNTHQLPAEMLEESWQRNVGFLRSMKAGYDEIPDEHRAVAVEQLDSLVARQIAYCLLWFPSKMAQEHIEWANLLTAVANRIAERATGRGQQPAEG